MNTVESVKVEVSSQDLMEIETVMCPSFKTEPPDVNEDDEIQSDDDSSNVSDNNLEPNIQALLSNVDDNQIDSDLEKNYELTMSDIEREVDAEEETQINCNKPVKFEDNLSKYPCNLCDQIFDSYGDVREHKKLHFIEKRTCDICGIVCRSIGKLEVHRNSHLGLKPCVCNVCGKSYSSSTQLRIHNRIHTDEKRYKCKECNQAFRYNGTLKSHIRLSHTKIMENTCRVCSKYCASPEELKSHMSTAHSKRRKVIKCQLCEKTFKSEKLLSCHLKVHTELKFPCEFCQRIYPSLYRLKKHVGRAHIPNICECKKVFYDRSEFTKHNREFHKTEESTVCQFCNKEFDKPKNLTEHIRLQHKGNGKVNKCTICEKEFINASLLRNHIKTHDKSFKCEYCDKIFGSRYNLQIHLVVHTKERKHKCETCGNCYGTKTSLKNHQYIHSEERNYSCPICSKSFKSNHRLYAHKFSHETEKKFECEVCQAKFTTKQYLNFHMKKHSDAKPFECVPCQRRFKHKRSWDKHCLLERHRAAVMNMTAEWQCDYCEARLPSESCLMEHIAEDHAAYKNIKAETFQDVNTGEVEEVMFKKEIVESEETVN